MKITRDPAPELRAALQAEQFRILRTQVPVLYAVLSVNTGILCYSIYRSVPVSLSLIIPGAFASLILVHAIIWLARHRKAPSASRIARYLMSTTLIAGIVSLGLGLWGVALLRSSVGDKPFVPLFIAFGATACAYCLARLPKAAFATIVLSTTPVVLAMLTSGVPIQEAAGLNLLIVFLLIVRLIVHQYRYFVDSVITHSQLRALAYTDPLTSLPNRRAFIEQLEEVVKASNNSSGRTSVAMIDLDGFKAINDTYGHAAGDAVLIQAAQRIQMACIHCPIVARLGGDEFAALIVNTDDAAIISSIGRALVHELSMPFAVAGSQIRLGASIGIATHAAADGSATAIMSRADVALYDVKRNGGGGIGFFRSSMGAHLRRRILIEQALRETATPPQIQVVYQPIFDARSREIVSFEALARWDHPQLGMISPLEFVSIAEQIGMIAILSDQIFATAIAEAASWAIPISLSVNLSAIDLCRSSTPLTIMSLCQRFGLDPRRLELEVTETAVLSDFDAARAQLDVLRRSGIRVALDDFGSGFASISYLKEITFDRVKIDGELISGIIGSPKSRRLVQGILQLCSAIGIPTTAEKVETEDQLAILVGLGCDRLQGFLLGKPLSAERARLLATGRRNAA